MSVIRFIHTADIHFGMENYGKIDPKTGIHTRLLDFERAFNFCIDVAIEQNVDFFLFAGDAYKTAHPSPTQQKLFLKCLLRLFKANIPVVMVIGNHDNPLSFGKAHSLDIFADLPLNGFHVFAKPGIITLQTKNGPCSIVGMPWPTRNTLSLGTQLLKSGSHITQYISQAVADIIKDLASQVDQTIPAVLVGHLTVSSGIFSGSEKRAIYGTDPILLPSQLAISPFDYVALGHLHRFQDLNSGNNPPIVYSGSLERVDFGERKEEKGFCLVTLNNKQKTTYEFIKTPTRPFIQIEVHLVPDKDQTKQILEKLETYTITDAVIKILYHIPTAQQDSVDLRVIHRACNSAMYVVGIIPVRKPETRERRTQVAVDMSLETILDAYFSSRPDYQIRKQTLISKTLELLNEHDEQEQQ
ncbi:MAG: metallophosphoesterase family protein [Candidatus Dependentiae bacterium]